MKLNNIIAKILMANKHPKVGSALTDTKIAERVLELERLNSYVPPTYTAITFASTIARKENKSIILDKEFPTTLK